VRVSTEKIRELMLTTVESIVEIDKELIVIKGLLPHGRFHDWLSAEFGWKERMARHFNECRRASQIGKLCRNGDGRVGRLPARCSLDPQEARQGTEARGEG
jgi:hypothetical protein